MKRCTKCGETKALTEFYVDRKKKDERTCQCKACKRTTERKYHEANIKRNKTGAGRVSAELTKLCVKCGETKELTAFGLSRGKKSGQQSMCMACCNAARRRRYAVSGHKDRAISLRWKNANCNKTRAYARAWAKANPIARRANQANRNARRLIATVGGRPVTAATYEAIRLRDDYCYLCRKRIEQDDKTHFDHIWPLARGGLHVPSNLACVHADCNMYKRSSLPPRAILP